MFTDMVGYSRLAQADEGAALALLDRHNRLLRAVFAKFRGREVKTVGDAFLVEFESALDAVNCALELQATLREHNLSVAEGERILVRVGIHVGDVVRTDGDVLGDAVNIASRIEPLAEPGGICLTQQVVDQVVNKVAAPLQRLPPTALKNIRLPVTVYRIALAAAVAVAPPGGGSGPDTRHLAVLPLANISPDPHDAYFADGLTEELISVLSQVRDLSVIARTSVIQYKEAPKPVAQVGADLGVDTVLEGSVRKAGNRIRIALQLIDVATQGHIWTGTYNRELDDVFAVQEDVAQRTAEALRLEFARQGPASRDRRPTANLEAYDLYLRGLVAGSIPAVKEIQEALRCFEQATVLDPSFAEAYAAWADLYVRAAGDTLPMADVMPKARPLAARALELDPGSSDAHAALANIAFQFDQDWGYAEAEFRRAIALNGSNVMAHRFLALMLIALDRLDEARDETRQVLRLNPSGDARATLGLIDMLDGEFEATLELGRHEVATDPTSVGNHVYLGLAYASAGKMDEARREAEFPVEGADDTVAFDHALLNAVVGRPERARAVAAIVERGEAKSYTSGTHLAMLYANLGEPSRALDLLEEAYRQGDRVLWLWYRGVWFDPIRHDSRFLELLRQYGVPTARVRGPPHPHAPDRTGV